MRVRAKVCKSTNFQADSSKEETIKMEMRMRECMAGDGGHACIPEIDRNSACERVARSQSRRKAPGCKLKSFSRFSGMKLKIGSSA